MDRSQLPQLSVLASVARHGSFRAAARELGLAPSAVSHAVTMVEERIGVRLLSRTTRSVAPTEEGARLLERLTPALAEIERAVETAAESRAQPAGNLRITVPRAAATLALAPRLGAFARAYPLIALDLVIDDRFTDLVAAGFDAGVRLGEALHRDMVAVRIGPRLRGAVVAAPSFLDTLTRRPAHPRELLDHPCIRFRFSSGVIYRWEFEKDGETLELAVNGPLIVDDDRLNVAAALGGAGFAFIFEDFAQEAIQAGRLIRVLEDWCPPFDGFHLYYPSRRQMRPALRAFVDFFRWRGAE